MTCRIFPDLSIDMRYISSPNRSTPALTVYSGHLLAMLTIYSVLFNDDRYSEPGSLKFVFDPIFWGMGPETFEYDIDSLQHVILGQMERSGWLGCCCESNMRFIVCNQFPLVAFRLNDLRKGTRVAPEAQAKYSQAWAKKGWLDSQGYFIDWHRVQQDKLESRGSVGWSAWAATFMNAWNPAVSREVFPKQIAGWVRKGPANGTMSIASPNVAALRRAELAKGASEADLEIENEQELNTKVPWMMPLFGYIVAAISELGPREKLDGLLNYADTFFNPTWREGGLYYPMNPKSYDDKGNHVFVDPLSGNAMIAYARLNVEDGMRKFYDGAWKKGDERWNLPFLESVEPANKVDVTRARFFETEKALVVGIACWNAEQSSLKLEVKIGNATDGSVEVLENGEAAVGVEVKRREGCVVLEFDLSGTDGERVFILRV